jgi:hypothetical protein
MSSEKSNQTGLVILDAKGQPINGDVLESLAPAHNGNDDKFALNLYHGIASGSFSDDAKKVLAEDVIKADVQIRPDGIIYLPGVQFRNRLNNAFGPGAWAIYPLRQFMDALRIYYEGALIVNGRYIAQSVGECEFHANNKMQSYASAIEAAKTDCITRCCKDLGIAEELWDPNFIRAWKEDFAEMVEVHHKRDPETCWIWKRKDQRLQYPYKNLTAEELSQRKPRQSSGKQPDPPKAGQGKKDATDGKAQPDADKKTNRQAVGVDPDVPTSIQKKEFLQKCADTKLWLENRQVDSERFRKVFGDLGFTQLEEINSVKMMDRVAKAYGLLFQEVLTAKGVLKPANEKNGGKK